MHGIRENTQIFIFVFAFFYLLFLARKAAHHQVDVYDVFMLSMVAIVPGFFVIFPRIVYWIAKIVGIEFPFVIMFGFLFAIIFLFIHRLTIKIHRLESENRLLIQETSLLKHSLSSDRAK